MQTFIQTTRIPRQADGRFATYARSLPEPSVTLIDDLNGNHFGAWTDGRPSHRVTPNCIDDLRGALDATDKPQREARVVRIVEPMALLYNVNAVGAGDEDIPLLIEIFANRGPLAIQTGNAVVYVKMSEQCEIEVADSAFVTVIVANNCSAVITVRDDSEAVVVAGRGARGGLRIASPEARGELHGDTARFGYAETHTWRM